MYVSGSRRARWCDTNLHVFQWKQNGRQSCDAARSFTCLRCDGLQGVQEREQVVLLRRRKRVERVRRSRALTVGSSVVGGNGCETIGRATVVEQLVAGAQAPERRRAHAS